MPRKPDGYALRDLEGRVVLETVEADLDAAWYEAYTELHYRRRVRWTTGPECRGPEWRTEAGRRGYRVVPVWISTEEPR